MNYGMPYMGSKSKICESVCRLFPRADHFYDLFGGGFSITHFMIKHRASHFKEFHFNEIRPGICDLIKDAIAGKYNYSVYSPPWISREDFFKLKETDPMVKIIWSFGNNGKGYIFGKDIEKQKRSMHMAVVFNEFDDYAKEVFGMDAFKEGFGINQKRLFLKNRIKLKSMDRLDLENLERLQQLENLERLQQLERLEQLQQLEQPLKGEVNFHTGSYDKINVKDNSVIYCDIPYKGTADYGDFSHSKFFDWAAKQEQPVFISEYGISDTRFKCVANFKKRSLLTSQKRIAQTKTEKVFVNQAGYEKILAELKGGA